MPLNAPSPRHYWSPFTALPFVLGAAGAVLWVETRDIAAVLNERLTTRRAASPG